LAVGAAMTVGMVAQVNATPSFPEANYQLVYDLSIPNSANYLSSSAPYSVINTASISNGSYARVGYMLQLQTAIGSLETVAVSMDAFTTNPSNLGVPTVLSGEVYNEVAVTNMNVTSNVPGVAVGTGLSSGYLQFWPDCYNHSGGVYATGFDTISAGSHCYGSMQIGNGLGNTVFAYNSWDGGGGDVGIGNQATGNPDWTFAHNASSFVVEDLSIWVSSSVPEPASIGLLLGGLGVLGLVRRRAYKHTS
jgi:sialate O-acetylesterase